MLRHAVAFVALGATGRLMLTVFRKLLVMRLGMALEIHRLVNRAVQPGTLRHGRTEREAPEPDKRLFELRRFRRSHAIGLDNRGDFRDGRRNAALDHGVQPSSPTLGTMFTRTSSRPRPL